MSVSANRFALTWYRISASQMGADRVMMKLKFEEMNVSMREQQQVYKRQKQSCL